MWSEFARVWADGCFDFGEFGQWISNCYYAVTTGSELESIWLTFLDHLSPLAAIGPYLILLFCLSFAFFGRTLMPTFKFIAVFVLGYIIGVYYLPPAFSTILYVPDWILGLVVALVLSVFYRFIYSAIVTALIAYLTYTVCYLGFSLGDLSEIHPILVVVCIVIALFSIVIAFYYNRYIEMIASALLGAYLFTYCFRVLLFDYEAWSSESLAPWVAALIITALIAAPAFVVQLKTGRKY